MEHVMEAIAKIDEFSTIKSSDLTSDNTIALHVVKMNSPSKIGDLYKKYCDAGGKSVYKTFQRRMKQMEDEGFVNLTKSTGEGGNTTIVEYKERLKTLSEF